MIGLVKRISDFANRATELALVPIVLFFTGLLIVAVFSRYVFQLPIVTSIEMTRLAFVWAVFLGAAAGVKRGVHVRVVAFMMLLPERLRGLTIFVVHGAFLVFACLMIWHGAKLTIQMKATSFPTLGISQAWLYLALPVAGVLIAIHAISGLLSRTPVDLDPLEEIGR